MGKANSHLYLSRHNIYYCRVVVPIGIPGSVIKKEYRRSLRTRDPKTAQKRCAALRVCLEGLCNRQRCVMVGWSELQKILDKKLMQLIAQEHEYVERNGPRSPAIEKTWLQEDLPFYQNEINAILNSADDVDVPLFVSGGDAKKILEESGIDLSESPELFVKFCVSVLQMYIAYNTKRIEINNAARAYVPQASVEQPIVSQSIHIPPVFNSQPLAKPASTKLLSEVIEEYCEEKIDANHWKPQTQVVNKAAFQTFLEIVNDMPIAEVTSEVARYYKSTLRKLPANRSKRPQYREKSIKQLQMMKVPAEDRLSISKVNSYLGLLSSFFKWADTHGYVERNVFTGLSIKDTTPDHEKRLPFDDSDLQRLFETSEFQDGERLHPYYYWLPLIALYSGARIEEICQLGIGDVHEVDDVLVFDIVDTPDEGESGGKQVKTASSRRKVPVHSRLIELGLLDYVARQKEKGKKRLFPELEKKSDKYSRNASRWFGRYRKKHGVVNTKKTFHSFRHTVANHLKQNGAQKEHIAAILGHKDESITTGLYGEPYKPAALQPIIEMLHFPVEVPPYS